MSISVRWSCSPVLPIGSDHTSESLWVCPLRLVQRACRGGADGDQPGARGIKHRRTRPYRPDPTAKLNASTRPACRVGYAHPSLLGRSSPLNWRLRGPPPHPPHLSLHPIPSHASVGVNGVKPRVATAATAWA